MTNILFYDKRGLRICIARIDGSTVTALSLDSEATSGLTPDDRRTLDLVDWERICFDISGVPGCRIVPAHGDAYQRAALAAIWPSIDPPTEADHKRVSLPPAPDVNKVAFKRLQEAVEATPGLTLGYIGNYESWGDDTSWRLWVDGSRDERGNNTCLWSCDGKSLDRAACSRAQVILRTFRQGFKAGQRSQFNGKEVTS